MPLLHWLTRDDDINTATHAPYRLLEEVAKHSHGDRDAGNMLIQGDNLDALKALLPYYAGRADRDGRHEGGEDQRRSCDTKRLAAWLCDPRRAIRCAVESGAALAGSRAVIDDRELC